MTRIGLLGVAGMVAASIAGCGARQGIAQDRFEQLLATPPSRFDERTQERALETLESVPDTEAVSMRRPIERACLDGRGQEIAPLIAAYLDKLARANAADMQKAQERILTRCGVYDWQARESRAALFRVGPRRYARRSETEIIRAVVAGTDG